MARPDTGELKLDLGKRLTRPPVQREWIAADLRRQILAGDFAPGASLPPRTELQARYKVSPVTLQRAMDRLATEGFITASPQGTAVARRVPHLCRYGVVYPARDTADLPWGRFYRTLRQAAAMVAKEHDIELSIFYCGGHGTLENQDYRMLAHIVKARAVAGLLLINPFYLLGTPILKQKEVPLVSLVPQHLPDAPALVLDRVHYAQQAMQWFHAQGRKRPAFINSGLLHKDPTAWPLFRQEAERYGMELRPQWLQTVPLEVPDAARNAAHLLFAQPQDRPDALLIADDNLVEAATQGLLDAGVRSPQDVAVVAHCNFPAPPASPFPVSLLGYDSRQLLYSMIATVDRCREQGTCKAETVMIPARFEPYFAGPKNQ